MVSGYRIDYIFPLIIISLIISGSYSENGYYFGSTRTIAAQNCTIWTMYFEKLDLIDWPDENT